MKINLIFVCFRISKMVMNERNIRMRWSRSAVVWTVVFVALMVILAAEGIAEWRNGEPAAGIVCWVIAAVVSVCALWTPLRIIVTDRQIQLCRPVGRLRINRSDIVRVEEVSSGVVLNSFRVGSGGPFGYWGRWQSDSLGWYTLFATNLKDLCLIRLSNGRAYIVSSRTLLLTIKQGVSG